MSLKQALLAASVAAGLAGGGSALAQPAGGPGHGPGPGHELGEILHSVQLTSAQKQQIHQLMTTSRTQDEPQMTQLRALDEQMTATMLGAGSVTEAQLLPLEQKQATLRQQLDTSRLQTMLAIRNLLTSAQLAQAASTHAQLAALHQQEHALMGPPAD